MGGRRPVSIANIEIAGELHNVTVRVPDEGGYVKAKAEYIIPHLMSIIAELSS